MTTNWNRKDQHIHFAHIQHSENKQNGFEGLRFIHQSLSPLDVSDVSIKTKIDSLTLNKPFFINAMTGGSQKAQVINENLSIVAKETGLAMAVGSVSTALAQPEWNDSFTIVRKINPNGIIFSNLGAHHSVENAKRAVDLIQADALQLHLNIPQELVMPEGDREFSHLLDNIEDIVKQLDVPIIVKEVGFGMSKETYQQLINVGVTTIDVSGKGGTNFIQIENERREYKEYSYLYDWGQTTAESLLEAQSFLKQADFIASGGIHHPLDMLKAFRLGASAVGMSGEFLNLVLAQGNDAAITRVNQWTQELTRLMTMIGKSTIADIKEAPIVLDQNLTHWCNERQITLKK